MKTNFFKIRETISLLLLFFLCLEMNGQNFYYKGPDGGELTYSIISNNEVYVYHSGGNSTLSNVIIPEKVSYNGKWYTVTEIGDLGLSPWLKTIQIPNTVKKIQKVSTGAFHKSGLTSIKLPNSITEIGDGTFSDCVSLKSVQLSNSLKEISSNAFEGCRNLENIEIPNSVEEIDFNAFQGCTSLKSIKIPSSVTKIRLWAFERCTSLVQVKGLYSGIEVSGDAFKYCPFNFEEYKKTFEYAYQSYLIPKIKEWQKKKDFETNAQYQNRITKENQQRKITELTNAFTKEYTTTNKLQVSLGDYDSDYNVYELNSNYGKKYIKIPSTEVSTFKNYFGKATFDATYMICEEGLKIKDLVINVNGKKYQSERMTEEVSMNIDVDLPEINMAMEQTSSSQQAKSISKVTDNAIDQNIPIASTSNRNTFAVIIGNERYTQVAQVPYASNDARIFAEYCKKTLGLPEKNVKLYENASYGTMIGAVSDIQKIAKAFNGNINVIFYYAGHGIPDETTGDGYLLPVDANGINMRVCYPLSQLYKELGEMQANSVICFMDACFSGAQRGNGMIVAARGVAIKAKNNSPMGNTVVFTAATDKQTAYPYEEKGHGMFTYYLLKKIRETKGDCSLGELGNYICDEVTKQAVVTNGKEQTPVVLTSMGMTDKWKKTKLTNMSTTK